MRGLDSAIPTALHALREGLMTDHGGVEAARHGVARSPHWGTVEREFKLQFPGCAAGGRGPVQVHHIFPFHYLMDPGIARPDLELDMRNLIGLTEGPDEDVDGEYHLLLGHRDNFKGGNLDVKVHAAQFRNVPCKLLRLDPGWLAIQSVKALDRMTPEDKAAFASRVNAELPFDPSGSVAKRFGFTLDPSGKVLASASAGAGRMHKPGPWA